MTNFNDDLRNDANKRKNMEKPDQVQSDNPSLFEMHEDMATVDALPVEELNEKVKDEKHKEHTKDTSSSEDKYKP